VATTLFPPCTLWLDVLHHRASDINPVEADHPQVMLCGLLPLRTVQGPVQIMALLPGNHSRLSHFLCSHRNSSIVVGFLCFDISA